MDKNSIVALPHSSLREKSKKVHVITDEVKKLIEDMKSATLDWEDSREHEVGVALAAVQVNSLQRVVIVRGSFKDKTLKDFDVFINPEIVKYEGKVMVDFEGCLSIKQVYGRVPRYSKVRIAAQDINGRLIKFKVTGFLARVFQHEIDHTKGTLFVDHIKGQRDAFHFLNANGKIEKMSDEEYEKQCSILW